MDLCFVLVRVCVREDGKIWAIDTYVVGVGMRDVRGRQMRVGEVVSKGGDTNRNASRRCNGDLVVSITCKDCQRIAGLLKNGSIVGMCFHDCKYGLSR